MPRTAKPLHYTLRWLNLDTGRRGTVPRLFPFHDALDEIARWTDKNPSIRIWPEPRADYLCYHGRPTGHCRLCTTGARL